MKVQIVIEIDEMPKCCDRCRFCENSTSNGMVFHICKINGKYGTSMERPQWCPLKEVKE